MAARSSAGKPTFYTIMGFRSTSAGHHAWPRRPQRTPYTQRTPSKSPHFWSTRRQSAFDAFLPDLIFASPHFNFASPQEQEEGPTGAPPRRLAFSVASPLPPTPSGSREIRGAAGNPRAGNLGSAEAWEFPGKADPGIWTALGLGLREGEWTNREIPGSSRNSIEKFPGVPATRSF